MKARYWLFASLIFGAISAVSHTWLENISCNYIFLTALSSVAAVVSLAAAVINVITGNPSDNEPLQRLNSLKKFIKIILVLTAITFLAVAENLGGDNGDSDEVIYALFALIFFLPAEIVVMIISTIIYYTKKKRYNADTENISEDISDETKL